MPGFDDPMKEDAAGSTSEPIAASPIDKIKKEPSFFDELTSESSNRIPVGSSTASATDSSSTVC